MTPADITRYLNIAGFQVISCLQQRNGNWNVLVTSHVWANQTTIEKHVASAGLTLVRYGTEPMNGAYLIVKE